MTLTLTRNSNRLTYANLRTWWASLADNERGGGWDAYDDDQPPADLERRRGGERPTATMLLGAIAIATMAGPAQAVVPFDIRIESEKPGMQKTTATFNTGGAESFDTVKTGTGQKLVTDFGTDGAIKGTYTNLQVNKADQYGGAGGSGRYAVTFDAKGFTLDLTTAIEGGVNYFGYWLSALDRGNKVTFLSGGKELFTFNPQDVLDGLAKTGDAKSYYSNPNKNFAGQNSGEPYVFVNFFSNKGGFDQIRFFEDPRGGGYESDNHTVGNYETKGTGTVITISEPGAVPEPAVWATMIIGLGMVGASSRRRNRAVAF